MSGSGNGACLALRAWMLLVTSEAALIYCVSAAVFRHLLNFPVNTLQLISWSGMRKQEAGRCWTVRIKSNGSFCSLATRDDSVFRTDNKEEGAAQLETVQTLSSSLWVLEASFKVNGDIRRIHLIRQGRNTQTRTDVHTDQVLSATGCRNTGTNPGKEKWALKLSFWTTSL